MAYIINWPLRESLGVLTNPKLKLGNQCAGALIGFMSVAFGFGMNTGHRYRVINEQTQ